MALVLIVAGLGFKVSAVPFHQWTPDAYQGAPLPITAFLSAAGKAAAFAFFLRLFSEALLPAAAEWSWLIAVIAALTMITGNLVALRQTNMKRLMAYSSIGQVGYLLIGIVALDAGSLAESQDAATALVLHLLGYVATNVLVFTALIAFYNRTGKDDIVDLRGLAERQPMLALLLSIALFSLAGMPLFAGFATKFVIFQVAASNGHLWLAVIGVTVSFVSLYYYLMVIKQMYLYKPEGDGHGPLLGAGAHDGRAGRAHRRGLPGRALPGAALQGDRRLDGDAVPRAVAAPAPAGRRAPDTRGWAGSARARSR